MSRRAFARRCSRSLAETPISRTPGERTRGNLVRTAGNHQQAAWEEATRTAGELIRDVDGRLKPGHDWRMEITDEFSNPLWETHVRAEKK